MDWKNHIVADVACPEHAKPFVPYANEAFLLTLANKGLYKRALKDLEVTTRIEISLTEDGLQVRLDDAVVSLHNNVGKSSCSCPSKTVCKHILMAIMAAAEYASHDGAAGEVKTEASEVQSSEASEAKPSEVKTNSSEAETKTETVSAPEPWAELKKADIASLRKAAGKKLFEDTLHLIQDGWTADITEGDMLEATLNTENITVYFPRHDSLNGAVCKCGAAGLCKHKLIAILSYLSRQGHLSSQHAEDTLSLLTDDAQKLLESADHFIIHLLEKGIISCGESEVEASIQYSIRLEACGIGNLSRLFRSLSTDLENMQTKNIGFNQITTFGTLARLHNTMRLIRAHHTDNRLLSLLMEGTRSEYYTTPLGHFTGLGACPWQTRSGYFGITAYLFYHEKQTICTYTVSLADYYEQTEALADLDNLTLQYKRNDHWNGSASISTLSHSTFTLRNFKLNSQNRLSSSKQTLCDFTGKVSLQTLTELASLPLFARTEAETDYHYDYFQKKRPPRLLLMPFHRLGSADFNHTEQKLHFMLLDEHDLVTEVSLDFSDMTKEAIRYLERSYRTMNRRPRYMVCLLGPDGMTPVSVVDEKGVVDFYFKQ